MTTLRMRPLWKWRLVGAWGVLVLVLAACGSAGTAGAPSGSSSGASTPSTPSTSTSSPATGQETTMTGQVIEGVKPSCVILQVPDRRYALTGDPAHGLAVGTRVRVRGTVRPDLVSPCGSTTFVVTAVTRL